MLYLSAFSNPNIFWSVISDFVTGLSGYQPQKWGTPPDVPSKCSLIEVRQWVQQDASIVMWERTKKPAATGVFSKACHTPTAAHPAMLGMQLMAHNNEHVEWLTQYLCSSAATSYNFQSTFSAGIEYAYCNVDLASTSLLTASNIAQNKDKNSLTQTLMKYLPDLVWGQVFGPAYVELFGLEKLLEAPAYRIENLTHDAVYLQLTESIFDVRDNPAKVEGIRQEVKQYLDDNIFFDPKNSPDHLYRTPSFNFED
jgi:hypothetical protein